MQKKLRSITVYMSIALSFSLFSSGCTYLKFPGVYQIPVQQGNIIDPEKVDQLEVGMSKRQVQYVMGAPLVEDIFTEDRWDYVYQFRRGDKTLRNRRLTVFFEGDTLVRFEGDYEPSADEEKVPEVEGDYVDDGRDVQADG